MTHTRCDMPAYSPEPLLSRLTLGSDLPRAQHGPLSSLALLLPKTGHLAHLLIYYAAAPLLLPAGFPRVLPDPFSRLARLLPRGDSGRGVDGVGVGGDGGGALGRLRTWLLAHGPRLARGLWCASLALLCGALCVSKGVRDSLLVCDKFAHGLSYGCRRDDDCAGGVWSARVALYDLGGVCFSVGTVVGVAAAVPRSPTIFAWAGRRSWQVHPHSHMHAPSKRAPVASVA